MSPSTTSKSEVGESSSYEHMEQALIRVASNTSMNNPVLDNEARMATLAAARPTCDSSNGTIPLGVESNTMDPGEASRPIDSRGAIPSHASRDRVEVPPSEVVFSGALSPPAPSSFPPTSGTVALNSLTIASSNNSAVTRSEFALGETSPAGPPKMIMTNIPDSDMYSAEDDAVAGAAAIAAAASSTPQSSPPNGTERSTKSKGGSLRRGKWTAEEETYVARVIQDFNSGFLNAPAGTTLRSYLSDKLQCDPMRITKKFTGDSCIGKRVFHPAVRSPANSASIDKAQV